MKITFTTISNQLKAGLQRFPLAISLCVLETVLLIIHVYNDHQDIPVLTDVATYYLPYAALLSVGLTLWNEEQPNTPRTLGLQAAAHVAWMLLAWWWSAQGFSDVGNLMCGASATLLFLVFLLCGPFLRYRNDLPLWNFSYRILIAFVVAMGVGILMIIGISVLLAGIESLFAIDLGSKYRGYVVVVCFALIAPVVFMQFIPSGYAKHNTSKDGLPPLLSGVAHYLLMPLLMLYILVLYVYGARIVFALDMPKGMVSTMVSIMMLGVVVMIGLIYPSRYHASRVIDRLAMKWLPGMALPLLLLMTFAIARRVNDYGMTTPRLYLITFNVWCFLAVFCLIALRRRRFSWLPASFAIIFFVFSFGPWSFHSIMLSKFRSQAFRELAEAHSPKLPLTADSYKAWKATMNAEQLDKATTATRYLAQNYNEADVADIMDPDCRLAMLSVNYIPYSTISGSYYGDLDMSVTGYKQMKYIASGISYDVTMAADSTLTITLSPGNTVQTTIAALRKSDSKINMQPLVLSNARCAYRVTYFRYKMGEDKITMNGFILTK